MKSIQIISLLFLMTFMASCLNDIDNYDSPNAGIEGVVKDNTTNAGIQSEQPNGFRIRLIEQGRKNVVPLDFWGKADGTFMNTQLFANTYKIIPIEGPFMMPDTQVVKVSGLSKLEYTVTPYMTIHATAPSVAGKNIVINYTVTKPGVVTYDIVQVSTLVAKVPAVSISVNDYQTSRDLSASSYTEIAGMKFTDEVKNLPSGKYYVRVAGKTNNPLGKYNYSEIFTVTIP